VHNEYIMTTVLNIDIEVSKVTGIGHIYIYKYNINICNLMNHSIK